MNWHDLAILLAAAVPISGAPLISWIRDIERTRNTALWLSGVSLLLATTGWQIFFWSAGLGNANATTITYANPSKLVALDLFNAPLVPLSALIFFMTTLSTLRTKTRRVPFAWLLTAQTIVMLLMASHQVWMIILLLTAQALPVLIELRARGQSSRVFAIHMIAATGCLAVGWLLLIAAETNSAISQLGLAAVMLGVLIRCGIFPFHCWLPDLFERATFASSLLFIAPMTGAYATIRLVLPIAPNWLLHSIAIASLVTSVYAAGMALVQAESRRFFCYLFLSHSSLVLVAVDFATPLGMTGGLCVWLAIGIALTGFGLCLRALESRVGRLSMLDFHGFYDHVPILAGFFLLSGLASIGFPGTVGFIGTELLVEGAIEVSPWIGAVVVLITALNGIAVMHAYFRLFTGPQHTASLSLRSRPVERIMVLALSLLIIIGGLVPQIGSASRFNAASLLVDVRSRTLQSVTAPSTETASTTITANPSRISMNPNSAKHHP